MSIPLPQMTVHLPACECSQKTLSALETKKQKDRKEIKGKTLNHVYLHLLLHNDYSATVPEPPSQRHVIRKLPISFCEKRHVPDDFNSVLLSQALSLHLKKRK